MWITILAILRLFVNTIQYNIERLNASQKEQTVGAMQSLDTNKCFTLKCTESYETLHYHCACVNKVIQGPCFSLVIYKI